MAGENNTHKTTSQLITRVTIDVSAPLIGCCVVTVRFFAFIQRMPFCRVGLYKNFVACLGVPPCGHEMQIPHFYSYLASLSPKWHLLWLGSHDDQSLSSHNRWIVCSCVNYHWLKLTTPTVVEDMFFKIQSQGAVKDNLLKSEDINTTGWWPYFGAQS